MGAGTKLAKQKGVIMCYRMGLSTDCPQDLAVYNTDILFFQRQEKSYTNLHYPQVYHLATITTDGCGCFFRILATELVDDPGFCPLQACWRKTRMK